MGPPTSTRTVQSQSFVSLFFNSVACSYSFQLSSVGDTLRLPLGAPPADGAGKEEDEDPDLS